MDYDARAPLADRKGGTIRSDGRTAKSGFAGMARRPLRKDSRPFSTIYYHESRRKRSESKAKTASRAVAAFIGLCSVRGRE